MTHCMAERPAEEMALGEAGQGHPKVVGHHGQCLTAVVPTQSLHQLILQNEKKKHNR